MQIAAARALGQVGAPDCLETLVHGLENASPELGEAIAWALGQIPWQDPERVIDVLIQGADRTSRLGALDVLGQLGHTVARELVRTMLSDTDEAVVCKAVRVLGEQKDRDAVPDLLDRLRSPVETVRIEVLDALCRIHDAGALPGIRQAIFDPAPAVRARAVLVLGALQDLQSGEVLRGVLASPRSTDEMRGFALLGLMALDRPQDLPSILDALQSFSLYDFLHDRKRSQDPLVQASVEAVRTQRTVEFLVASLRPRREVEETLLGHLETAPDEALRVKVIRTLGYLRSEAAYPAVLRAFHKDPAEDVRIVALAFLAEYAPREDFVNVLLGGLQDLQPRVRAEAMRRLHRFDTDEALAVVVAQLDTEDDGTLDVLVEFLSELPPARLEAFLDAVMGCALRPRAHLTLVRLLGCTRFRGAAALLGSFLEAEEPEMRRTAVRTLSHLPGRQVAKLLRSCLQDPDLDVRRAVLDAAAALGGTTALPLLRAGLEDPAGEMRRSAILHLARLRSQEAIQDFRGLARDAEPGVRAAALAALAVEGSEPVEEWIGPRDVPMIAEVLREMHPVELFEKRLAGSRQVAERVGALKALFLRDPQRRARALAAARLDPSRRIQAAGARLEEILQVWLLDPQADRLLGAAPLAAPVVLEQEGSG